jgi:hypothetical protein
MSATLGGYQTTAAASIGYCGEFTKSWMTKIGTQNRESPSLILEEEVCQFGYRQLCPSGFGSYRYENWFSRFSPKSRPAGQREQQLNPSCTTWRLD